MAPRPSAQTAWAPKLLRHPRHPDARRGLTGDQLIFDLALDPLQPFFGACRAFAVMRDDCFELLDTVLGRAQLTDDLGGELGRAFAILVREAGGLLQHG